MLTDSFPNNLEFQLSQQLKKEKEKTTQQNSQKRSTDVNELFEVVKIERFVEVMLVAAFGYLLDNEGVAKAFMAKNVRLTL